MAEATIEVLVVLRAKLTGESPQVRRAASVVDLLDRPAGVLEELRQGESPGLSTST